MKKENVELLNHFHPRIEMYVQPVNEDTVTAFISGLDIGSKDNIAQEILNLLKNNYNIETNANGLSSSIEIFSKKKSISWIDGFKTILIELLKKT